MNLRKYKVSDSEVTIYTQRVFTLIGHVLVIISLLSFIGLEILSRHLSPEGDSSSVYFWSIFLFTMLPCLLLYYLGSKKIIISQQDGVIYKQFFFLKKTIARFSEIKDIGYVGGTDISYKAFLKSDPYGKGITLSPSTTRDKYLESFEEEVLPVITRMIKGEDSDAKVKEPKVAVIDHYKYYFRKDDLFILKRKKEIIWSICLVLIGLFIFYLGFISDDVDRNMMLFAPIPMTLIGLAFVARQKHFNTTDQTLTISYWFVYKKTYPFAHFTNFRIVRNTTNGMYSGTDIKMVFKNEKFKVEETSLRDMSKTKNIERLLMETRSIMGIPEPV